MKKFNLRFLLIAILFFALFTNCSNSNDENSNTNYHLEMKINGEPRKFNQNLFFAKNKNPDNSNIEYIGIGGYKGNPNEEGDQFSFEIEYVDNNITIGTYLQPIANGNINYDLAANYSNNVTQTYFSSLYLDAQEFKITITQISDVSIKGTFSGKMKNEETHEVIEITDGRFMAPIIH